MATPPTPAPGSTTPTGRAQLRLSYSGNTIVFQYNPTSISFGKGVVTNTQGTIVKSQEQLVTSVDILTFTLKDLRLEGKAALAGISLLLDWLVYEPGPPPPPAPPSASGAVPPPPPAAGTQSSFTQAIQASRAKVTGNGPMAAATNGGSWGKDTSGGKSSNDRGGPKVLDLTMGTGAGYLKGDGISGTVIMKKVDVTYTRFNASGDPIRASVGLTLETFVPPAQLTNPTSFSPAGGRVHLTTDGDTLPRLAQKTYDTPSAWRAIAEANGIDDPLRMRNGRSLLLPFAAVR
jgi:hypothetical protein